MFNSHDKKFLKRSYRQIEPADFLLFAFIVSDKITQFFNLTSGLNFSEYYIDSNFKWQNLGKLTQRFGQYWLPYNRNRQTCLILTEITTRKEKKHN